MTVLVKTATVDGTTSCSMAKLAARASGGTASVPIRSGFDHLGSLPC